MNFRQSIFSEVNNEFISNPYPEAGDTITISIRMLKNREVDKVFFRGILNGGSELIPMNCTRKGETFVYYSCDLTLRQAQVNYHFQIHTKEEVFFYTRAGLLSYHPTEDHDFVIIADLDYPSWVPGSVFYQIFPDRFARGSREGGVQTDEYSFDCHTPIAMQWDQSPMEYREGFCLDFFNGDLSGIEDQLDYLEDLGVTALFLNPIFRGKTNHRYDCIDYFHVDEHIGGDEGLIKLTKALHKRGMKIILDVSINHTGTIHPWFQKALKDPDSREAKYYYRQPNGTFGCWMGVETLPQLNYGNEELRETIFKGPDSLVRHYLKAPFHIDGWRFDVGNHTARRDRDQFGNEVFREIRKAVKEENPEAYIIGEHWEDNIDYLLGDQWDGAMNYFASGRPLRRFAGELDRFILGWEALPQAAKPASGKEVEEQVHQHFHRIPNQLAFLQYNLLDSHDIHRFHNHDKVFNWEIYRGMIILLFLLPGTPSIYYGDEIGLNGTIQTVEGCRHPMKWEPKNWNNDFLNLYKVLAHLKKGEPALQTGGYRALYSDDETLVYARFLNEKAFLGIITRNSGIKTIKVPAGELGIISATEVFTGADYTVIDGVLNLPLGPEENLLLACEGRL